MVNFPEILSRGGSRAVRRCGAVAAGLLLFALLGTARGAELDTGTAPSPPADLASQSPLREYTDAQGRLCRVYAQQVVIEGTAQIAYATVCREADGRWVLSR